MENILKQIEQASFYANLAQMHVAKMIENARKNGVSVSRLQDEILVGVGPGGDLYSFLEDFYIEGWRYGRPHRAT